MFFSVHSYPVDGPRKKQARMNKTHIERETSYNGKKARKAQTRTKHELDKNYIRTQARIA